MVDPVSCPMCRGAIPGKEIHILKTCPCCGADLSALIRRRLAEQARVFAPPPQPTSFIVQAGLFSLIAPCLGIAIYLFGRRAFSESAVGMLVLGAVSSLVVTGGFILGVVAFFAPKGQKAATMGQAIAGVFINGLLISFVILNLFTRQKVAASGNNTPNPSRKPSSFLSGK